MTRRHQYPYLAVVFFLMLNSVLIFCIPQRQISTVLSIEGLSLDIIGASLLATLDTELLYGRYVNEDTSEKVDAFYEAYEELSRNLEIDESSSNFASLAAAVERDLGQDQKITALEVDVSNVTDWDRLFAHRENPIRAFDDHHMIHRHLPMVFATNVNGDTINLGSHRQVRKMVPVQNYRRDQNQKYFRSAMVVLIIGFVFQILSYLF